MLKCDRVQKNISKYTVQPSDSWAPIVEIHVRFHICEPRKTIWSCGGQRLAENSQKTGQVRIRKRAGAVILFLKYSKVLRQSYWVYNTCSDVNVKLVTRIYMMWFIYLFFALLHDWITAWIRRAAGVPIKMARESKAVWDFAQIGFIIKFIHFATWCLKWSAGKLAKPIRNVLR